MKKYITKQCFKLLPKFMSEVAECILWFYQGRLEAARTNTRSSDVASPSIWINSSVFIRRLPSCSFLDTDIWFLLNWSLFSALLAQASVFSPKPMAAELMTYSGKAHVELVPLWPITDSSSSRKMVDGAWYLASSKRTCSTENAFTIGVNNLVQLMFGVSRASH